jgi:hypothetical protein
MSKMQKTKVEIRTHQKAEKFGELEVGSYFLSKGGLLCRKVREVQEVGQPGMDADKLESLQTFNALVVVGTDPLVPGGEVEVFKWFEDDAQAKFIQNIIVDILA